MEIGCAEPEGSPLDWRFSEAKVLSGLCETLVGSLERQEGKDFAFIRTARDDIFAPLALAKSFSAGEQDKCVLLGAIRRTNKQGKTGWRALKFIK